MKGDFSRVTFAERNHYRRVLMQQGRVEIDADGNEQVAIDAHIAATTGYDVIGRSGYPLEELPDGTIAGGFEIGLGAGGADLTLSKGRMYVDGLLVENDAAGATLLKQPDMPGATLAELGAGAAGAYVVYLDVWERLITALDNPTLRETALGGPDTSVRTKVVWQVRLTPVRASDATVSGPPTCAGGESWRPRLANQGTLVASSGPPAAGLPCILAPETGFQRLENQLYRVEIHTPGPDGTATFKWSRENGSVVAAIVAPPTTGGAPAPATATGPTFTVASLSDDPSLGFKAGDWVELTDDHSELVDGHGQLYQVATTPTDGHTVTISASPAPTVTLARHPKLRRWEQVGAGLDQGIPVTTATPFLLEGGVQVQFSAGDYQVGDYWLIPARTATSLSQGFVEWPLADDGVTPLRQPPAGIHHHYAKLALVDFTPPGTFSSLAGSTAPTDCRLPFLPLTELMPKQSLSPCTIVVRPGEGWQQPILDYFGSAREGVRLDAEICFPIGTFPVSSPVVISRAGHIKIAGAGWGTKLVGASGASGPESLLRFESCESVWVADLAGDSSVVSSQRDATGRNHINGTLSFTDCPEVSVEAVFVRCGSAVSNRGAACISVRTTITEANAATGAGSTRIRGCRLHVGEMQVGIQLVHQARATVEDNEILADPAVPSTTLSNRLSDPRFRAIARSFLISHAVIAPPPTLPAPPPAGPPEQPPADAFTRPVAPAGPATRATPPTVAAATSAASTSPEVIRATIPVADQPAPAAAAAAAGAAREVAARPLTSLTKAPARVTFGGQHVDFAANPLLTATWQTFLNEKAANQQFATQADALTFMKAQANAILTDPAARAGFSGFGSMIHTLTQHVPLAGRGIVVGGQMVGDVHIVNNAISGVILGVSVGVSHRASPAETQAKQRTPDHMQTVRISGNTIACQANDVAGHSSRFGVFAGTADSLEIDGNRLTLTPVGIPGAPFADAIRVIGYLGAKAVVRHNHTTGFGMGIRVVPLRGTGPGVPVGGPPDASYFQELRGGDQWLVADNVIEGASQSPPPGPFTKTKPVTPPLPPPAPYIEAGGCLLVNNVHR